MPPPLKWPISAPSGGRERVAVAYSGLLDQFDGGRYMKGRRPLALGRQPRAKSRRISSAAGVS